MKANLPSLKEFLKNVSFSRIKEKKIQFEVKIKLKSRFGVNFLDGAMIFQTNLAPENNQVNDSLIKILKKIGFENPSIKAGLKFKIKKIVAEIPSNLFWGEI